ncbi:M7GpppX diphosphatase [Aphelenchoides besseyi]|nr:M7GpppX diphosphatase [Aphelenchoides besseyi]
MSDSTATGAPVEKKLRSSNEANGSGDAKNAMEMLKDLRGFVFKEVLGSVPEKKKQAFPEAEAELHECISSLQLIHLSNNTIYVHKSTFIYPATDKHIEKYRFKPMHLLFETPDDYKNITLPFIQDGQFSIDWVYNILDGKKEQDTVILKDEDKEIGFVLARDLKWTGDVIEQLYYQAIVVRRDLKSIRDLTERELPLLKNILKKSIDAIFQKHGVPESRLKIHFHYYPSYYHLHVHFQYIGAEVSQPFVYLQQAIANIELIPDYYQRATLSCVIKEGQPLFELFKKAGRGDRGGGNRGGKSGKMNYKQKSSIRFIDDSDPPFIRAMKEKMGYQEHKLEDKFEENELLDVDAGTSNDPDDIRNMKEGERPQVVVLDPSKDLTVEELDDEVRKKMEEDDRRKIEEGKITFKKPVKRTTDDANSEDKPEDKKKRSDPLPKKTASQLLSFGDDEEE